nr:transposase [Rhizobium leguminosarum]
MLQVDGYSGYRPLTAKNTVSLAFCWSHVRRRFYELAAAGPAPIATEALRRIAELYKIEDEIRGRTHKERSTARQESSRPITDSLAPWLREELGLQKTKLAEAIRYALSTLGRADKIYRRWPDRDRLQHCRAIHQADCRT